MNQRLFIVPFLFAIFSGAIAQDSSSVFNVTSGPYNLMGSVVSPAKMNVLYIGVENPIDIAVPGVAAKDITAGITEGTIKKISDGHFVAMVTAVGKFYIIVKVKDKEVSRHEFRVKLIPDPKITLTTQLFGGTVSDIKVSDLQKMTGIVALMEYFDFDAGFRVQSFQFIFGSNGNNQSLYSKNASFTAEMLELLKKAKAGDTLIIDDIKVSGPDSKPRKVEKLVFNIR